MRFCFTYQGKWYENNTRVILKDQYIEKHSDEKKIPKEIMFTRTERDETIPSLFNCYFMDYYDHSCIEYHNEIIIREDLLDDAIEEISFAKEMKLDYENDTTVVSIWQYAFTSENILASLLYCVAMFFSLVFSEFYILWIIITLIYIKWKVSN